MGKNISDLAAVASLTGAELMEVEQSGVNKRTTAQAVANLALGSDLTAIEALTPSNDDFLQRKSGAWANRTLAQVKTDLGVPTYARYVALLTQTGTDAPVATVLENTLGGTVVWSYEESGSYIGTLTGVFTQNKTLFFLGAADSADTFIRADWVSVDSFRTVSYNAGGQADDELNATSIEVRVYP